MFGILLKSAFRKSFLALCLVSLVGCSDGGEKDGPAPVAGPTFTADAGADMTVNMLSRVELNPKVLVANVTSATLSAEGLEMIGSSQNQNDVVSLSWRKIEGPVVKLQSSGLNDGTVYFIAPEVSQSTGGKVVFKLTLTNAAGKVAEDTVVITINRINVKPIADAGTLIETKGTLSVTLNGSGSKDSDGSIQKYLWTQISGQSVSLQGADSARASFSAPPVTEEADLEFQLLVQDNEGASNTAKVVVRVKPNGNPEVVLYFPPPVGAIDAQIISAFGTTKTYDSTLSSVTVDIGTGPIPVTTEPSGAWRIDKLTVPTGVKEFTLTIVATDSAGRQGKAASKLKTSIETLSPVGSGDSWRDVIGMGMDAELNKIFVLSGGNAATDVRLISVDLNTGNRSPDISNFGNTAQGPNNKALVGMTYDASSKKVFLAAAPADTTIDPHVLSIDVLTGQRSILSDATHGVGEKFKRPWGIAIASDSTLYLADNLSSKIIAVNTQTGDRSVVADKNTFLYGIDAPALLAIDPLDKSNQVYLMPNSDKGYVLKIATNTLTPTSTMVSNFSDDTLGPTTLKLPTGMVVDSKKNQVFVIGSFNELLSINTLTGVRKYIYFGASQGIGADAMTYDSTKHLLYLLVDFPSTLWVLDPESGSRAVVSKN